MTTPWLEVIGIGVDGWEGLSEAARHPVLAAELIVGGARHLAMVPPTPAERMEWPSPLAAAFDRLESWRGRPVCVLASGDPMWFGIGATLAKRFGPEALRILPHSGAFSLAAARLGWPLHEVACLSAHGRPLEALALNFHPGARLLVLAEDGAMPARLAGLLCRRGYGASRITAFENLDGAEERARLGAATEWNIERTADLVTLAVEVAADPGTTALPRTGLPDEVFIHDGQLTKREIRAATLAALAPYPSALLWDVGAGCGSIAIEWMRCGGHALALEPEPARRDFIARNALALGVPGLEIIAGRAPEALARMPGKPDAVFIGGGVANAGTLEAAWAALGPGGRLVANAVTAEAEAALFSWHQAKGGAMTRLAVTRLEPLAGRHIWRPLHPVTQYCGVKG